MPIDTDKQRELERRVTNCIYLNISDWMDFAISGQNYGHEGCPVDVDEIPSFLPCEDCKGTGYELLPEDILTDEAADDYGTGGWCWHFFDSDDEIDVRVSDAACGQCDDGEVVVEIFEWYHVDRGLAARLAERGEVVLEGEIWGRQCTGQAIFLDSVMEDIFEIYP